MQTFLQNYGLFLLPILLAMAGVYLLLPKVRRSPIVIGALLCAAGIIGGGLLLIRTDMVLPETILFYAFSAIAVNGGVLLICQSNPVHAALSFALVVLSTSGLFLLNGAPFLMAATIMVYAGAIIVTFLFVIMLAHQRGRADADQRTREPFLATVAGFVLLAAVVCVLKDTYTTPERNAAIAKLHRAADAPSRADVKKIVGDPLQFIQRFQKLVPKDLPFSPKSSKEKELDELRNALKNVHSKWRIERTKIKDINKAFARLAKSAETVVSRLRRQKGNLAPNAKLPVSTLSGQPATIRPGTAANLPANNVSALGTSLFTDYLLAVEIAGLLLLVASVGALVIAGRRTGDLR